MLLRGQGTRQRPLCVSPRAAVKDCICVLAGCLARIKGTFAPLVVSGFVRFLGTLGLVPLRVPRAGRQLSPEQVLINLWLLLSACYVRTALRTCYSMQTSFAHQGFAR